MAASEGWRVEEYTDKRDKRPVDEFLRAIRKGAGPKHEARIRRQIKLLEAMGLELGREHIARLKSRRTAVWELRATFQKNPYRILFYQPEDRTLVLLHGFHKKVDAVPASEIQKAEAEAEDDMRRRM